MITDQDLRKYLIQFKLTFGLGLTGIFSIMKVVFDYQHVPMGIGYIALIIGIGNITWAIYDYIMLRKMKNTRLIKIKMKLKLKNLLFVCERNEQRSPTFETWFRKNRPQYDVKSAGIFYYCPQKLTKELLEWADAVYVMDLKQEMFIAREFPEFLGKVVVVGCDDDYQRESSLLFKLIEYWANKNNL